MEKTVKPADYYALIVERLRRKYPYFLAGLAVLFMIGWLFISYLKPFSLLTRKQTAEKKGAGTERSQERIYTVQEGDDLWKISEKVYGTGYGGYDIASFNQIKDPNLLEVGQKLRIPSISLKPPTGGDINGNATTVQQKPKTYTVKAGEALWQIALRFYGRQEAWVQIAAANNITSPDLITEGMTLILP